MYTYICLEWFFSTQDISNFAFRYPVKGSANQDIYSEQTPGGKWHTEYPGHSITINGINFYLGEFLKFPNDAIGKIVDIYATVSIFTHHNPLLVQPDISEKGVKIPYSMEKDKRQGRQKDVRGIYIH